MDSQASVLSVKDRLPRNCFLNLDDDDEATLQLVTQVETSYFSRLNQDNIRATHGAVTCYSDSSSEDEDGYISLSEADLSLNLDFSNFEGKGCGCTSLYGRPCSDEIGIETIKSTRLFAAELTSSELDLIVLAHLHQNRDTSNKTKLTKKHTDTKDRKRSSIKYYLCGKEICKTTYKFSYGLSEKRLKNLFKHYDEHGMTPRTHGNKGKIPHNTTDVADDERVVSFIRTYADINGLPLPGRMPKMKDYTVMMLPSDRSKSAIWREYVNCSKESGMKYVGLSKFKQLWQQYLPDIAVMKISSDLCDTCQTNNSMIMKSANLDEYDKSDRLHQQEQHLKLASECRKYYKAQCENATDMWGSLSDEEKKGELDGPIHISFDYAQNLLFPYSPQQVGPMYFKTPRKCAIFGVCSEHIPKQINYLIDEGDLTGKGANETISYLHHYLFHHINKTKSLQFHCDNCCGQNKNNYLMQYMCWRILSGQNKNIEVSFMLAYHTRFGPDWCFGLVKLKYRRSYVSSMSQIADVVSSSTTKNVNEPQMIRDPATQEISVNSYNWKTFFSGIFERIPNISKYHHFRFSSESPGNVYLREFPSSSEVCFRMIRDAEHIPNRDSLPLVIKPPGLLPERAWYLYDNVRRHCDEEYADITFPKPEMLRPSKTLSQEKPSSSKITSAPNKSVCKNSKKQRIA